VNAVDLRGDSRNVMSRLCRHLKLVGCGCRCIVPLAAGWPATPRARRSGHRVADRRDVQSSHVRGAEVALTVKVKHVGLRGDSRNVSVGTGDYASSVRSTVQLH